MDDSELYLVRIWRGGTRFRASARRVDEDSAHLFTAPEDLTRYLAPPPDPPTSGPRPDTAQISSNDTGRLP